MEELKGFEVFDYYSHSHSKPAYMSITENGITFNKTCILFLGFPKDITFLINKEKKQIAIMPCETGKNSIPFCKNKECKSKRINLSLLKQKIQEITKWDLLKDSYRIRATLLKEDNVLLFDLKKAVKFK